MAGKKKLIEDGLVAAMRAISERDAAALSRTGSDPSRFLPYVSNYRRTETSFYDPKYWSVTQDHLEYPEGTIVGTRDKLLPIEPTRRLDEILKADPELMYRGMSADELASFLRSAEIKSTGSYNMTGQEGLTYFTSDPDSAQFYANSFAPEGHKPNMERPAYVVAAKRAPSQNIIHVPGVAEHEIGVNRATPVEDVVGIYRGTTTDFDPGVSEKGLYVAPRASLNWEGKTLDEILKGRAEGGPVREGYQTKGRVVGDIVDEALKLVMGAGKSVSPEEKAENLSRFMRGSQLIDEAGNPQRLYHITDQNFDTFIPGGKDPEISGPAIWLSPYADKQPAMHNVGGGKSFKEGTNVMPVYARMKSPLVLDTPDMHEWARAAFANNSSEFPYLISPETKKAIQDEGYDGIILGGRDNNKDNEIIVFEGNQIKSAIGNAGSYDPDDPRIDRDVGGRINSGNNSVSNAMNVARGLYGEK